MLLILEDEEEEIIKSIFPITKIDDSIKKNKIKYLIKDNKKIKLIDKNKIKYIIKDEVEQNKEEEISYIEIEYDFETYREYNQTIYVEDKKESKEIEKKRIIYLIKYEKQNIKEEEIIYIILEYKAKNLLEQERIIYLSPSEINEIIKDKQVIYLLKNDKDKNDIDKDEIIYIIKDDDLDKKIKTKEKIYMEIKYEVTKYKKYKQTIYLETKEIIPNIENKKIVYIEKYEKNKQKIENEKIIYILLEYGKLKDKKIEDLTEKFIKNKSFKEFNNLLNDMAKNKRIYNRPPNITYFRFFDSRHNHLSSFNIPSMIQREGITNNQTIFFNTLHKRYSAFRLFYFYNIIRDPRKKCLKKWSKNI